MLLAEISRNAGRFCEVATTRGVFYGELLRLSSALFLIRPRLSAAELPHTLRADEITRVTPLPDPR
jgi:hypothetical protein